MCTGNSQRVRCQSIWVTSCARIPYGITSGAIELNLGCLSATIDRSSARGRSISMSIRPYSERRNLESQTLSLTESQTSLSHTFVRHCEINSLSRFLRLYRISTFITLGAGSSQSVSIYRWEIEAKISVSVSIFLDF